MANIGKMDRRVSVQRRLLTKDDAGGMGGGMGGGDMGGMGGMGGMGM